MTTLYHFGLGFLIGTVATTAVGYAFLSLLPATRETPEREPLVGPRDPDHTNCHTDADGDHCDCHAYPEYHAEIASLFSKTSGDGHVRWTPLT